MLDELRTAIYDGTPLVDIKERLGTQVAAAAAAGELHDNVQRTPLHWYVRGKLTRATSCIVR